MTPSTMPRLLLTPREAAQALSVSQRTLWSLTSPRGPLPVVRVSSRAVRYSVETLARYVAERESGGNQAESMEGRDDES